MKKEIICPSCGYRGIAKRMTKGYLAIEIILWMMFIVPGLIYSIWRETSRYQGCPKCGAGNLVPADSPRGIKLIDEYYA
ncbi:MAG TPA: hypothetical protein ENG80_02490 [Nitrospirae bacterium]|nr:hypothetical protein [Nitrospirota bacterium]